MHHYCEIGLLIERCPSLPINHRTTSTPYAAPVQHNLSDHKNKPYAAGTHGVKAVVNSDKITPINNKDVWSKGSGNQ